MLLPVWLLGLASSLWAAPLALFPADQIRPGMRGQTHTVMQGTEIIVLETELLGVQKDAFGPGRDMIIGKLVDEKTRLTGAVHGMSGSPLYIEGKLVGALSRRLMLFEKDGHCGFTPIADILDVQRRGRGKKEERQGAIPFFRVKTSAGGEMSPEFLPVPAPGSNQMGEWLGVPLSVSGWSDQAGEILNKVFRGLSGAVPVMASGPGQGKAIAASEIRPGSPLSVLLVDGDIRMGGTGTATTVDGNKITAFGHPMLGVGSTELPLAGAEIITTMPSYYMPHKIANIGTAVGTLWQDRLSCIAGELGPIPQQAAYHVTRRHEDEKRPEWKGSFVKEEWLAPRIMVLLMMRSLMDAQDMSLEATFRLEGELRFKGLPPMKISSVLSGGFEERFFEVLMQMMPVAQLYEQFPKQIEVESFDLKVESFERASQWEVETVQVREAELKPGQTVKALIRLKNGRGETRLEECELKLPEELKRGNFQLRAMSGNALQQQSRRLRNVAGATSPAQFIQSHQEFFSANQLYVQVVTQQSGVVSRNRVQLGLPYSIGQVTRQNEQVGVADVVGQRVWTQQEIRLNGVVRGGEEIRLEIK
ncbi:MAG: hypothetical protein HC904_08755 [Blastochloris sp.]|nr:hypothetical protein [Blastochloris sp.]